MIWKDVKGYEGLYQISDNGQLKHLCGRYVKKERILQPCKNTCGYLHTNLTKNGKQKDVRIHRLVAEAFVPNPDGLREINHIDDDKTNNNASNLEWCSRLYNLTYGERGKKFKRRKVYQYSLSGEFLSEHDGWKAAEESTGVDSRQIFNAAHRKNGIAHGYVWGYE